MKRAYEASIKSKDGEISRLKREMEIKNLNVTSSSCVHADGVEPFGGVIRTQVRANVEIGKDKLDIRKEGGRTGFSSSCESSGDDDIVTDDFQSDEDGCWC